MLPPSADGQMSITWVIRWQCKKKKMKRIRITTRRILIFLLLVEGMNLYGQNGIEFSYKCENEIKRPFNSRILLKLPKNKTQKLFSDTINDYHFKTKNFLKIQGKCTISIFFEAEKYGKDSIDYNFELNGNEINTEISVRFDYSERLVKKGEIYEKGEKVLNGYIEVANYYKAPNSINIELDKNHMGDEYYKGPFFRIKNNSKDTFYGEHLPGYFWGTLSFLRNDSILTTRYGTIDYMFVDSPPLYPDSTKIATVGSFGYRSRLLPFDYRFNVMLAKKYQSIGVRVFDERKNFVWWADTKEFYKLTYDFKIDETPNP